MTAADAAATTNLPTIVFLPTKGAVRASIKPTAYSIQSFLLKRSQPGARYFMELCCRERGLSTINGSSNS
jgi:hypothetical protein